MLAFSRDADGSLTPVDTYPTGGAGGTLGSGHAIVVSRDGHDVVAVNAGSDSITAFEARHDGLHLIATVPSGGVRPTSVTIDKDVVYVLNAGSLSIAGFQIGKDTLTSIAGSVQALGAGAATPSRSSSTATGRCWSSTSAARTPSTRSSSAGTASPDLSCTTPQQQAGRSGSTSIGRDTCSPRTRTSEGLLPAWPGQARTTSRRAAR